MDIVDSIVLAGAAAAEAAAYIEAQRIGDLQFVRLREKLEAIYA
jgi:hypothetical protein